MEKNSCLTCPSYAKGAEASFFGKSIGVGICKKFGKPIGRMTSDEKEIKKVAETIASSCTEYGNPAPASPNWPQATFQVMFPLIEDEPTRENPELVSSCRACRYFIPEQEVVDIFGWASGLCAKKGKLVLSNRTTFEARSCEYSSLPYADLMSISGAHAATLQRSEMIGQLHFLPEYMNGFGEIDTVVAVKEELESRVDPREYETDRPVDPEDADRIRAWRRIEDPESGNEIFLPIYRREFFSPAEQELIPSTGDPEHPEDYVDHGGYVYKVGVLWLHLDETPAFWGRAGTGKMEFFRYMAYLMQLPFHRFSITASSELDDLAGKMHYTEGRGTHFEKGRLVKAWESPCVMVVDEPNAGPDDVWQFLRPMTDNSKQLVLDQSAGERALRDDDCYLGMAMNPAWDLLNSGVQQLADADANRLMHMYIDLPPAELEREIIRRRCDHDGFAISEAQLSLIMAIAKDLRMLTESGELMISWAIRPQLKVARALRWFDVRTAYRMASADYLEPEQQSRLMDIVNTHVE